MLHPVAKFVTLEEVICVHGSPMCYKETKRTKRKKERERERERKTEDVRKKDTHREKIRI